MTFNTGIEQFTVRFAQPEDTAEILTFIRALAAYEKRPQDATADEASLHRWLFRDKTAEVLLADYAGQPAGYALFYPVFSSFAATGGLYLEDLFIYPHLRGKGLGKNLMRQVAAVAVSRGCQTMQWTCLDWNQPSIDFYLALGAKIKGGNTAFALKDNALAGFAEALPAAKE